MLGIDDPQVLLAYVLCIASAGFSVVYGIVNWNKGDDVIHHEDKEWVKEEKAVEEKL